MANMSVDDYYTNMDYWQEYDCASCGQDFDVYPIPLPNTKVSCPHCNHKQVSGEGECNTYIKLPDGSMEVVDYPQ
jgi:DNA-directed RNA polymerase subunit RPC12/RpoP